MRKLNAKIVVAVAFVGASSGGLLAQDPGSLSPWTQTSSLSGNRTSHAAIAYKGRIYVAGGEAEPVEPFYDSVEQASVGADVLGPGP